MCSIGFCESLFIQEVCPAGYVVELQNSYSYFKNEALKDGK